MAQTVAITKAITSLNQAHNQFNLIRTATSIWYFRIDSTTADNTPSIQLNE